MNKWLRGLAAVGFAVGMAAAVVAQDSTLDTSKAVEIKVDLAKKVGKYEPIYRWFGYDESNYSTTPNGRKLLGELAQMSPVPVYIRAHHLLTSGDGTPELKWSSTGVYQRGCAGQAGVQLEDF